MGRKRKSLHNTSTNGPTVTLLSSPVEVNMEEASTPSKRLRAVRSTMNHQPKSNSKSVPKPIAKPAAAGLTSRRNPSRTRSVVPSTPTVKAANVSKVKVGKSVIAKKVAPKNIKRVSGIRKSKAIDSKASKTKTTKNLARGLAEKKKKVTGKAATKLNAVGAKSNVTKTRGSSIVSRKSQLLKSAEKSPKKGRKKSDEPVTRDSKRGKKAEEEPGVKVINVKVKKSRKVGFTLSPKPNVTEYLVDPTFHSTDPIPYISPMFQGKLLIRAVLTRDKSELTQLVHNKKNLYSYCLPRSVSIERTALHYALMKEDVGAVKILMNSKAAEKLGPVSEWLIQGASTGRGSHMMFGHGLRSVTVGRGGKEGNAALLKDTQAYGPQCSRVVTHFSQTHILDALESGIKMSTLQKIASIDKETYFWHGWLSAIVYAVRAGQNVLAGELIEFAIKKGGFGFNLLHQEALVKTNKNKLSPFKSVSVPKKAVGNARITPVHCAAINPDPYCITALLSVNPDFNLLDANNWTPIHYAAVCSGPGPLSYLLSRGISTNMVDKDGNTPLHAAARTGRVHNVKFLLETESKLMDTYGDGEIPEVGSVTKINKAGLSPLHLASKYGHPEVVSVLLKANGVDGNKPTSAQFEKLTPLMLGSSSGHLSVVKALVAGGMKLELVDRRGRTALAHAVINGHADIVSYLLRLGDNHLAKDTSGNTLVHYAAAYGWYFNFKLLMEAGCCPNEPNQWKMTPIAIAFMKGHMGLVELLLREPGVNVNSIIDDSKGMTLLLQTCSFKAGEEMMTRLKFLVETQKADCSITDSEKNSAAHYLIQSEAREIRILQEQKARGWEVEDRGESHICEALKLVTENGCSLDGKNSEGNSSLTLGIQLGCFKLVELLLKLGGRLSCEPNGSGDTVLHLLIPHIKDEEGSKFFKSCTKNVDVIEQMKRMSNAFNSDGMSPLLATLSRHHVTEPLEVKRVVEFVLFLVIQLGSDVNALVIEENKFTDSVLHLAVKTRFAEHVLDIILSKKPNLEVIDGDGRTPLAVAVLRRREAATKILIENGANVNFCSLKDLGKSIIMLEVGQKPNSFSLIPFLVEKGADVREVRDPYNRNSVLHFVSKSPSSSEAVPAIKSLLGPGGLNPNVQNKYGRTSLHLAVNSRGGETDVSYDVESLLIESGASLVIPDVHGRIPLHFSFLKIGKKQKKGTEGSFMDPIELVTLLTSAMKESGNKRELDAKDEFGQLPLHCAATRGATISASHLIAETSLKGILDVPDFNGNSPFALAVMNGHEGCALMFLQAGANFLLDLNRCTATKLEEAFGSPWVWGPLKLGAEEQDRVSRGKAKYSILQEIVRRDWQGLLYLMLEKLKGSGVGVSPGIEAALKTSRLTLAAKLIDRVRVNKELMTKRQSLLHTLAQEAPSTPDTKEVQVRILKSLISKGADVNSVDAHQSTPLVYAAVQWNWVLCGEMTSLMNVRSIPSLKPDFLGRTPFSALFWNSIPEDKELGSEVKAWAEGLLYSGAEGNILTQYPIQESTSPTVRYIPSSQVTNLYMSSVAVKYSPLVMAVIYGNYGIVKWLLGLKGKIDPNFSDSLGRTPLMHAVKLNDIQMIKLLLDPSYDVAKDKTPFCTMKQGKTKPRVSSTVNVNLRDKQGWSVVHHAVAPRTRRQCNLHYALAGAILELLQSVGADFEVKSNENETPLELAVRLRQFQMVKWLSKTSKPSFSEFEALDKCVEVIDRIPIEVSETESKTMLSRMEEALMEIDSDDPLTLPDPLSGLTADSSIVLIDESSRGVPYDCLLTQVDLNYGIYGLYNFYKMQLIQQTKGPGLLVLFTRWGRVGDNGQYQKTPFPTLEEGVKEFKKIFRAKTGNVWEELSVSPFKAQPKKYRLVELDKNKTRFRPKYYAKNVRVDFEGLEKAITELNTKLPSDLYSLMKKLSLVHKYSTSRLDDHLEHLPFGLLSRESLQKADNILNRLQAVIQEKDTLATKPDYNKEQYGGLMNSLVELSEEFYGLILVSGFATEKISPLFQVADLRKKQELVRRLLHLQFATQLLLGAQLNFDKVNPVDYVYGSLGTRMQCLDPGTDEVQLILEYIHNTCGDRKTPVESIFRVEVPGEEERLEGTGIKNRHLLWHGTSTSNLLSILHRGLHVAPLGYSFNGALFGQGIYFADMFSKSLKYCSSGSSSSKFMLLCEVALGNVQKVELETYRVNELEPLKPDRHSLKTSNSKWKPVPRASVIWKGRTLQVGPKCENVLAEDKYHGLDYNEYIVFKPEQVALRYLIQFNDSMTFPGLPMKNLLVK